MYWVNYELIYIYIEIKSIDKIPKSDYVRDYIFKEKTRVYLVLSKLSPLNRFIVEICRISKYFADTSITN